MTRHYCKICNKLEVQAQICIDCTFARDELYAEVLEILNALDGVDTCGDYEMTKIQRMAEATLDKIKTAEKGSD